MHYVKSIGIKVAYTYKKTLFHKNKVFLCLYMVHAVARRFSRNCRTKTAARTTMPMTSVTAEA